MEGVPLPLALVVGAVRRAVHTVAMAHTVFSLADISIRGTFGKLFGWKDISFSFQG